MNDCEYYQNLISLLIDGEITEEEKSALAQHAGGCNECAAMYWAFKGMSESLSADLVEPPEYLAEDIMAEIRSSVKAEKKTVKNNIIHLKRIVAIAACAAVMCIGAIAIPGLDFSRKYSVAASAGAVFGIDAGTAKNEEAATEEQKYETPAEETIPTVDTSESSEVRVTLSAQPTPVNVEGLGNESSTPTVDLTGRGIGNKLSSYFSGSECDLPADREADRTLFIYYDPDGVTGEVLVKVFGDRVYYINLSGEESTAHLASCTWSQLSAIING